MHGIPVDGASQCRILLAMGVKAKRRSRRGFAVALAAAALAMGSVNLILRGSEPGGIEDVQAFIFGEPDLGPVDFATLRRRRVPNDALACPPEACPHAAADIVPPDFPVPAERLRRIVAAVAAAEPRAELVFDDPSAEQDRYVVRSRLLRFPDTVDVRVIGRGEGRSTLAIYSRSRIGFVDFGVNRARIARWLERVAAAAREGA
jgi:uncharacterized protein (DUF1499 family)